MNKLPIRIAHPSHPELAYFTDDYFEMLVRCGYGALTLDSSPFDMFTGNVAQFYKDFHLISLYDIAYSAESARMRAYIEEVAARAARCGVKVYLQSHEPRLPYYAWSMTPPQWRGHGGWPHSGSDTIAYCWSEPEAVAFWKQMARDAFAGVPSIAGAMVSFMDNEAVACDARCPKCKGATVTQMMRDVLETYVEIGKGRGEFPIHIVDWWMEPEQVAATQDILIGDVRGGGRNAYFVGHSCKDLTQVIDGEIVPGMVGDMTMISGRSSASFADKQEFFTKLGFRFIDRTTWSHASESWFLPAPPDPAYAIEKLNALAEASAEGWMDYDCGAIEPGSIADAIAAWTRRPDAAPDDLVSEVLTGIYGRQAGAARAAYDRFAVGKNYFPVAYNATDVAGFSSRTLALGGLLASPFILEDFVYFDTIHAFNFFAPFNLVTPAAIPYMRPRVEKAAAITGEAFDAIDKLTLTTAAQRLERDAFEIHYRQYRSIANYYRLGEGKLSWLNRQLGDAEFIARVRAIAADELENHTAVEAWLARNPGELHNPIHDLVGRLEETWPGIDFKTDVLRPKRRSLERLVDYEIGPALPMHLRCLE